MTSGIRHLATETRRPHDMTKRIAWHRYTSLTAAGPNWYTCIDVIDSYSKFIVWRSGCTLKFGECIVVFELGRNKTRETLRLQHHWQIVVERRFIWTTQRPPLSPWFLPKRLPLVFACVPLSIFVTVVILVVGVQSIKRVGPVSLGNLRHTAIHSRTFWKTTIKLVSCCPLLHLQHKQPKEKHCRTRTPTIYKHLGKNLSSGFALSRTFTPWIVLGGEPANRSHRVEQFTALWGL